ncbi:hypothetical protein C8E08_4255 [Paracidovorax citrulli]|uniref:Uncharacterized protein n=3 Tax=Paracidovorax citrulli TaxID=80869 RepID=A1TNS5_PARC0|nr:hypothetical protein Aave_2029 [Paracidovorax citrulli AAC00-1]PVY66832.1 hypothetical protein C8E08_4255 [Paracidovorax citrulli]QCX09263.1 hypothetical protein APS58_0298 [Paracidovorax citrulli]REG69005.1 hypothetical protein C8E07_2136 [Paracidovorax citrulli]RLJ93560.1 hypothetical protein C8E06_2136 [Paracidovorax citrulli]
MRQSFAMKSIWLGIPAITLAFSALAADEPTPLTLPLGAPMSAYMASSGTQSVYGAGTVNNQAGSGTGVTVRDPAVPVTFEGQPALRKDTVITLNFQTSSGSSTIASTLINYYDNDYTAPRGAVISGLYSVTDASQPLPATAKAGDSGTWYTMKIYNDSTKSLQLGTATVNYSVQADTDSTLLLSLVTTAKPVLGTPIVNTSIYRLGAAGAAVPVKEVATSAGTDVQITYE